MTTALDLEMMSRALQLAARGLYTTDPNPRVGCVIVRDGEVVGEGWHERAGEAHAEIHALAQAGECARGATVYVTLEPCCHYGRTPPCTDALIASGVARVVAAMQDPNPRVAGKGLAALSAAGIQTESGILAQPAEVLNPGFVMRMRQGRPFVRAKLAMSLDGRTAMASGESKWITGSAARADVQHWRARSSAIMTGVGTVLADDPEFTVRADAPDAKTMRQPLRVVLDHNLSTPPTARILSAPGVTLIFTACDDEAPRNALLQAGAEVTVLETQAGRMALRDVLEMLAARGMNEVLLESGATLAGAMLRAGLIDELVIFIAPHLLGDAARGLFHLPGLDRMDDRIALEILDIRAVGADWRVTAKVIGK